MEQLNLIIPGLIVDRKEHPLSDYASQISLAHLEKLIARSARLKQQCASLSGLCDLFGIDIPIHQDFPTAAISRVGEGRDSDRHWWFRIDPVYFHPDRDSIVLISNESMDITIEEARTLAAEVTAHYANDGWYIEVLHPKRWYLRLTDDPKILTHDLDKVIGRHIFEYLPFGERGRQWHAWLNEIQMLLHSSPINRDRQSRGVLPINALWLWGGGRLPEIEYRPYKIYGGGVLLGGMAKISGIGHAPGANDFDCLIREHNEDAIPTVMLDGLHQALKERDMPQWWEQLNQLEMHWFAPTRQAMKKNKLKRLNIYCDDGSIFSSDAKMQRRFWHKRKPLLNYRVY